MKLLAVFALVFASGVHAQSVTADARFAAFMQRAVGNQVTVGFGSNGTPIASSSAPLGTPSIRGMGVSTAAGGATSLVSRGTLSGPGGAQLTVQSKLALSAPVVGRALVRGALAVTAAGALWQAGSALYDIWSPMGFQVGPDGPGRVQPRFGGDCLTCKALIPQITGSTTLYEQCGTNPSVCQYGPVGGGSWCQYAASANESCGSETTPLQDGEALTSAEMAQAPAPKLAEATAQAMGQITGAHSATAANDIAGQGIAPQVKLIDPQGQEVDQLAVGVPSVSTRTFQNAQGQTVTETRTTTTMASVSGDTVSYNATTAVQQTNTATGQTTQLETVTEPVLAPQPQPSTGTQTEVNVETCGLPGKPACKIDETGTPTTASKAAADQAVDQAQTALLGEITGLANKTGPAWSWSFALPTNCGPIQTPAFAPYFSEIDVCQFQPTIHDLLSLIWIAGTIWGCVGMVGRTFAGG